jgi:hypothetical protein
MQGGGGEEDDWRESETREHASESESKHSILRFCEIKNKNVY